MEKLEIESTMGNNNQPVRWGILGAGRIAEKFCAGITMVDGASVYAIASRDADNARAFAARWKAPVHYHQYSALMSDENIDIIYIATPHTFHHAQTIACLQHNKPVLCEKPMSLGYHLTKEMTDLATEKKLFLMEGMWTACMPFIEKIQTIIKAGTIGTLQYISADFGFTAPIDPEGRLFNPALGGGAMMDVGIYPLYLAVSLLGEPTDVKGVAGIAASGIDEYANVVLQFAGGATAHLFASITTTTPIEAIIVGSKGKIRINNPWFKATTFLLELQEGTSETYSFPHAGNGFEHEIQEVMDCLQHHRLQSEKMPHRLTLAVSKTMDRILEAVGVSYSGN